MTTITGKLNGSITGLVRFSPSHPFVDRSTSPNTLVTSPIEASITNGTFTIVVPQSQNLGSGGGPSEGVTYFIELFRRETTLKYFLLDGTPYEGAKHQESGIWYTGSVTDASQRRLDEVTTTNLVLIQPGFHAIAPDVATNVDFTALLGVPVQQPYLNISLYGVADLITTTPIYRDRISAKLQPRGTYSATVPYVSGDVVGFNGNGYIYRNPSSLTGATPPASGDNTNWMMLVAKGAAGGTGAQIVGYNPATWANSSEAASREDVRAAIATIGSVNLSEYLKISEAAAVYLRIADGAPRSNPTFTGAVKRGAVSYPVAADQKATEIITAKYVEDAVSALGTGLLPKPLVHAGISSHPAIGLNSTIIWNQFYTNAGNILDTQGRVAIPSNGAYVFAMMVTLQAVAAYAANTKRMIMRTTFNRVSPSALEIGDFSKVDTSATTTTIQQRNFGFRYQDTLTAGTTFECRAVFEAVDTTINAQSIVSGVGNNYLLIWKVA